MTIITIITQSNYAATPAQVEQLAHVVVEGSTAGEVYLRVLLAHMQSKLGSPRRGKQVAQEPVLDAIHEALYPCVLKGVGPEDMPSVERNAKATFARSMASTIRYFVRGGGDVRGLVVATVTKNGLRKAVEPARDVPEGTRSERAFARAREAIVKQAASMLAADPDGARERIEALMDELEGMLPPEVEQGATTTIVGRPAGRASQTPAQLHRSG